MNKIYLEEKYIPEYLKSILHDTMLKKICVSQNDAKYHHNSQYEKVPSIIKNGILSMIDMKSLNLYDFSSEDLKKFDDTESHVNGIDAISLSIVGLEDLYYNEEEYDPYSPNYVDFLISSDIKTTRSTTHYGNEFLSFEKIPTDKFKSIDIRILKFLELAEKENFKEKSMSLIIEKYNSLILIANEMKQSNLDIPLREMSDSNLSLDVDALALKPRLIKK